LSLPTPIGREINRVVRRCLEKAPESRFQTARDLVFALENLAAGSEPTPAPAQPAAAPRASRAAIVAAVAVLPATAFEGIARADIKNDRTNGLRKFLHVCDADGLDRRGCGRGRRTGRRPAARAQRGPHQSGLARLSAARQAGLQD
jgi:hypothetical protein